MRRQTLLWINRIHTKEWKILFWSKTGLFENIVDYAYNMATGIWEKSSYTGYEMTQVHLVAAVGDFSFGENTLIYKRTNNEIYMLFRVTPLEIEMLCKMKNINDRSDGN
ncbi:unnamed protein product [Brugia timori]|uniref:Phage head-tail adaptor n=1 Tax=Brugia timori TaxID=42155 RepID=A0A0R3R7I6_9BILA|nr:unnamed protein product [Brugia timori]